MCVCACVVKCKIHDILVYAYIMYKLCRTSIYPIRIPLFTNEKTETKLSENIVCCCYYMETPLLTAKIDKICGMIMMLVNCLFFDKTAKSMFEHFLLSVIAVLISSKITFSLFLLFCGNLAHITKSINTSICILLVRLPYNT